jgi:LysR family transcriptional regulator, nitrogen assimilation regulatory protein
MEFRQLRYLVAIIDFGSISRASAQLNIAQPAVSIQMMNLEAELGAQLLIRSARGVIPTEAGMRLYKRARLLLGRLDLLRATTQDVDFASQFAAPVSIGLPTSVTAKIGFPFVRRMRESYPTVQLRLLEGLSGHVMELLLNNRLDLGVLFVSDPVVGLVLEPLYEEELFLVTRHAGQPGTPVEFGNLPDHKLALPGQPHGMRRLIDSACEKSGVHLAISLNVDSLPMLRQIASSGMADVILPHSALGSDPEADGLLVRSIVNPSLRRPVTLCRASGAPNSRAVEAVEEVLRQVIREAAADGEWQGVTLAPALATHVPDRSLRPVPERRKSAKPSSE